MKQTINIPPPNAIVIFRGDDGKVYFLNSEGKVYLTESYHGVHRIVNPSFSYWDQITGEQIHIIKSTSQEFIFALHRSTQTVVSKGGGKKGMSGLIIEDEDVSLGSFQTLNFEGPSVTVTNDGNGKATVTIGGGGMITGGGTVNRIAMFTPNGSTIGDSPLLRSGSDIIADGFMYFASGNGIDVVASGGADILNIGTTNADVINYGYAGTTHNMNGTVFNVFTTNLNVTDKIITLNDGGAAGSGGNVGFEIEEGGVATGYFIQNATRNGFNFQASAITGVATFDLSLLTANRTATLQNASGTIAYLSDIPAPIDAWLLDGNTTAGEYIGTNNAQPFPIRTNATLAGTISATQLWSIGAAAPIAGVRMLITGTTNDSTTYALRVDSSLTNNNFVLRNDGNVGIRTSAPTGRMTIFSSDRNHISLSIDGGLADRYLLYLDDSTEDLYYRLNNANHLFYAGGGAVELILTVGGAGATNGRVNIAPSTSANYMDNKFYVETSLNNDYAIWGMTLGTGGSSNIAGRFESLGIGSTQNTGGYFSATGATKNYSIISANGDVSMVSLQVGDAGLVAGDVYVDTAANILSNGDLILARVV